MITWLVEQHAVGSGLCNISMVELLCGTGHHLSEKHCGSVHHVGELAIGVRNR